MLRPSRPVPPGGDLRRGPAALALALLCALASSACRRQHLTSAAQTEPALPAPAAPAPGDPMPEWYPATLPVDDYVGAAACAGCHQKEYALWQQSPHGHAMAVPAPDTVRGAFDGKEVRSPGGSMTPSREGDAFFMTLGQQRHRVDLVLASGRQHQLYLTRDLHGSLQLLPATWATKEREWLLTPVINDIALDPSAPHYWGRTEVAQDGGCLHCHLSQGRTRTDGQVVQTKWVDLAINCEACHGPGRAHIEARAAHRADPYRDLRLLSKEEEGRLCARCHAAQQAFWNAARPEVQYLTIASGLFRPDATQYGTMYQYGGHVSSACYRRGALTCSSCHDPHRQTARSLDGESAQGPRADLQCTVCHRDLAAAAAQAPHSHHSADVRCIDCHMPQHWIKDSEASHQRVADHSIAIPRPQESIDHHIPNACGECHHDKDPAWALGALRGWQQTKALGVRPWVRAFALALRKEPGAKEALVGVLTDPASSPFWRASAIELLTAQPQDPDLVQVLAPYSEDPDPVLRSYALRGLWTHDQARRDSWLMGAAADADPLVRATLITYTGTLPVPDDNYRKIVLDLARYMVQPPGNIFSTVALDEAQRGQLQRALMLVDLALPHSTPLQIEGSRMRLMRDRLLQSLR